LQTKNAAYPIKVTEGGMVTEVKPLQFLKAYPLMVLTDEGIVTEVKPIQFRKANPPIELTDEGIV
jgi:hypothetical protein